jgi:hypothetical protein
MRSPPEINLAAVLALPPVDQLDVVLRAARLPVDERSRAILNSGFLRIWHECGRREVAGQPDLGTAFDEIAEALNSLLKFMFANGDRRHAVSIMEKGTIWHAPTPIHHLIALHDTAIFYRILHSSKAKVRKRDTDYDNLLYDSLYRLFAEMKKERPGNTYLLYNFTMKCVDLLGIKVGFITPDAFRMRIKRMLDRQRSGIGSLAELARDLPPVAFDQLSLPQCMALGTMGSIVSDTSLMAYWPAAKRRRSKDSDSSL